MSLTTSLTLDTCDSFSNRFYPTLRATMVEMPSKAYTVASRVLLSFLYANQAGKPSGRLLLLTAPSLVKQSLYRFAPLNDFLATTNSVFEHLHVIAWKFVDVQNLQILRRPFINHGRIFSTRFAIICQAHSGATHCFSITEYSHASQSTLFCHCRTRKASRSSARIVSFLLENVSTGI